MTTIFRFRQIRIDKSLYRRIKGHCVSHEIKISTFFEEVFRWFQQHLAQDNVIIYHASRQEDYLMTIRFTQTIADSITFLAKKERVSDARVIFTALSLYLESHTI